MERGCLRQIYVQNDDNLFRLPITFMCVYIYFIQTYSYICLHDCYKAIRSFNSFQIVFQTLIYLLHFIVLFTRPMSAALTTSNRRDFLAKNITQFNYPKATRPLFILKSHKLSNERNNYCVIRRLIVGVHLINSEQFFRLI